MRLATFTHDARTRIGIVTDDALLDLSELAPELPTDMRAFLAAGDQATPNTRHLIFDCFDQIAHLTAACTLEPGDILATGTPAGVGMAFQPPKFLIAGDVVPIEIEKIGAIEHTVVAEPDDHSSWCWVSGSSMFRFGVRWWTSTSARVPLWPPS